MIQLRKIIKRHKDKFTENYQPEVKNTDSSLIYQTELISPEDINTISKLFMITWEKCPSGSKVSYYISLVHDNIHKCPKSEYHYLYNMGKRFCNIGMPSSSSREMIINCKSYLDKINVKYIKDF